MKSTTFQIFSRKKRNVKIPKNARAGENDANSMALRKENILLTYLTCFEIKKFQNEKKFSQYTIVGCFAKKCVNLKCLEIFQT